MKYMFSFNHLDQPGLLINSYYKENSVAGKCDIKLNDRMNLKINVYGLLDNSRNNSLQVISRILCTNIPMDPTYPS